MAAAIYVAGPTVVKIDNTTLGYSDNDNLPAINFTDNNHEIKTVLSGATPEEIVTTGTTARISVALVKWDPDVLDALLTKARSAADSSVVGRRLVAGSHLFAVAIESVSAGGSSYVFDNCYLQSDGVADSQWGNRERVLTLNFMAIPNGGNLYTYTEVTT